MAQEDDGKRLLIALEALVKSLEDWKREERRWRKRLAEIFDLGE